MVNKNSSQDAIMGSGLHLYALSMVRHAWQPFGVLEGCFSSIGVVMAKIKDIIWSIVMTVSAIRKYGVYDAYIRIIKELHEERLKYWKNTGKHWKL